MFRNLNKSLFSPIQGTLSVCEGKEYLCVCYFLSQRHSDAIAVFAAIDLARAGTCCGNKS